MAETHLDKSVNSLPPGPVVPRRQIVTWKDGAPVVEAVPQLTPKTINDIGAAAVAQLYEHPDDALALELGLPPSEFYGMTLMEVMLIKQAREAARTGATDEVEAILDRRLGKPKQSVEKHVVTETYEEALARISKAAATTARPVVMDAEVVDPNVEDLL